MYILYRDLREFLRLLSKYVYRSETCFEIKMWRIMKHTFYAQYRSRADLDIRYTTVTHQTRADMTQVSYS
jgi:hypothetical protein